MAFVFGAAPEAPVLEALVDEAGGGVRGVVAGPGAGDEGVGGATDCAGAAATGAGDEGVGGGTVVVATDGWAAEPAGGCEDVAVEAELPFSGMMSTSPTLSM